MKEFKKGLVTAFLAVAATVFLWPLMPSIEPPFIADAVTCFPMPSTAGLMPEVKSLMNADSSDEEFIERERSSMDTFYSSTEEAKIKCSTSSCEPPARKAYRSATSDYIWRRENVTRNLYRKRGKVGLAIANQIFGTERDLNIIAHLKAVTVAGRFEISKLGKTKESAALLVYRGPDSYMPCNDPDQATPPG